MIIAIVTTTISVDNIITIDTANNITLGLFFVLTMIIIVATIININSMISIDNNNYISICTYYH